VEVKLVIGNVYTKAVGVPEKIEQVLHSQLSFRQQQYVPSFRGNPWRNVTRRQYHKGYHRFPTGHLNRVGRILQRQGVSIVVEDQRTVPPIVEPIDLSHLTPRDYQDTAINVALDVKSGVWLIATGGGKSFVICATAGALNLPTMIYVHTLDLLDQMRENLYGYLGIEAGQIGDGVVDIRQFTVATMQTAIKALGKKGEKGEFETKDNTRLDNTQKKEICDAVQDCNVAIVDEVHHATCQTIQAIMQASKSARYRFGATATLREDGADLLIEGAFGKRLITKSASELINEGWLVPPTIYFYDVPSFDPNNRMALEALQGNYHKKYNYFIVNNEERNRIACRAAAQIMDAGMKVLVLVRQIAHGRMIFDELGHQQDYSMAFVEGRVRSNERRSILEDFRRGMIQGVVATSLADEGLDIPILDSVIMLGGGKSRIKAMQRIGRSMRLYDDGNYKKTKSHIVEFADSIAPFDRHARSRIAYYRREPAFRIKEQ